jgi:hypothetical protein
MLPGPHFQTGTNAPFSRGPYSLGTNRANGILFFTSGCKFGEFIIMLYVYYNLWKLWDAKKIQFVLIWITGFHVQFILLYDLELSSLCITHVPVPAFVHVISSYTYSISDVPKICSDLDFHALRCQKIYAIISRTRSWCWPGQMRQSIDHKQRDGLVSKVAKPSSFVSHVEKQRRHSLG